MLRRIRILFMIALFATITIPNSTFAQSDPCSLPTVLSSFEAAALSGEVETWVQHYGESDCPQNVKSAVTTFALGYRQASATSLGNNDSGIPVDANGVWTMTGILIEKGQHFTVKATGRINPCRPNTNCDKWHPANGEANIICNGDECLLSGAPYSALVARIGDGSPFLVGSQGDFKANSAGELQFAVNDTIHHDNRGSFSVTVTQSK